MGDKAWHVEDNCCSASNSAAGRQVGDKHLVTEVDCFSADVSAGGELGDRCLTIEDDCASG